MRLIDILATSKATLSPSTLERLSLDHFVPNYKNPKS